MRIERIVSIAPIVYRLAARRSRVLRTSDINFEKHSAAPRG